MRLDLTTLTTPRYDEIVTALLAIDAMATPVQRELIVSRIPSDWKHGIAHSPIPRVAIMTIWDAANTDDRRLELFDAIAVVDPATESEELPRVRELVEQALAFVDANRFLYPALTELTEALRDVPPVTIARWLTRVQSTSGVIISDANGLNAKTTALRELLLTLGNYPARADGSAFPLFTFVLGIAADSLAAASTARIGTILDGVARNLGVTNDGIARLRAEIAPAGLSASQPSASPVLLRLQQDASILIRIEPDPERSAHYFFQVYDWLPWESDTVADQMRSTGRATNPGVPTASLPRERLVSREAASPLALEIGRRLLQAIAPLPLVEFLVPSELLGEAFDLLAVDAVGNGEYPVPLGTAARVVIRPLARWAPQFRSNKGPVAWWQQRWQRLLAAAGKPPRYWPWPSTVKPSAVFGQLKAAKHQDVTCVALTFVPTAVHTDQLAAVVLASGTPTALWLRRGRDADAGQVLTRILDAPEGDLRDLVHAERVTAEAESLATGEMTLLWDDPDRPPITVND